MMTNASASNMFQNIYRLATTWQNANNVIIPLQISTSSSKPFALIHKSSNKISNKKACACMCMLLFDHLIFFHRPKFLVRNNTAFKCGPVSILQESTSNLQYAVWKWSSSNLVFYHEPSAVVPASAAFFSLCFSLFFLFFSAFLLICLN